MDPKADENHTLKTGTKQHVLKKILSDKENKKSSSSSSSKSKKDITKVKESKKTSPDSAETSEEDIERPESRDSPETNCAICLETLQNKSFTDSCFHTFCFACLLEWSKVKAECPLCKQQFKSIVHNVRKDMTYDEYVVGSRINKYWSLRTEPQRFRYPTTLTAARILERSRLTYQESYQSQIASHRMRFAPHSVNPYSSAQVISRLPCPFRQRIYEQNLWVKHPPLHGRIRTATPEFFRHNQACTHRLIPWLNRELTSLWQDNDAHVSFVLELIMSLVQRYPITSQEFLIHIEPYLGRNTHHFIHELHSFAISPYDMENYDALADYGLAPHSNDNAERSSPDSDVIAIFTGESTALPTSLPRQNRERKQNMQQQALKHLKMILKKSSGNRWHSYFSPVSNSYVSSSSWSNPGPSTSGFGASSFLPVDGNSSNFESISDVEQTDEDEIEVLNILKPRGERTPEIVDLSSDEDVPVTVIDVSSDEGNFSLVCSPSRVTPPLSTISVNDASSDIECILEYQPSTSRDIPTTSEVSTEKDIKMEKKEDRKELHHDSSDTEELESDVRMDEDVESEKRKTPKLASAIVRPWMTESESSCKSFVPQIKKRFSSSYLDDSLSENSSSERKHSPKKLKLQSVVACFSVDRSGSKRDSSHRSSHKKRKEKKKKKKHKHIRQHRHNRIYSDSDSG